MNLDIILDADPEWDSNTRWDELALSAATAAIAESAFPQLADGPRCVEISLRLAGDDEVRLLNAQWRGKDKPTNVLSFPMAEGAELSAAKAGEDFVPLLASDVAGERHDQLVPGDGIRGLVVCSEDEHSGFSMVAKKRAERLLLGFGVGEELSCLMKG